MPGLPLPFLLFLLTPAPPRGAAQPFPRDLIARSTVGLAATAAYPRFGGLRGDNVTAQLGLDFQRMLRLNGTLFVAARDHIYAFDLGQDKGTLYPERHLTWETRDRANCAMRGRLQDECHNYIRVLVPRDAGTLLACGTNAFSPVCRTYQVSTLAQEGEEVSGQARCPFDAQQSIVALFVDGSLYSATVADFQARDAVIYRSLSPGRPPLRTLKYSSRWLQEPHFVQALPYGPFVYFFFREVSVELSAMGKVLVARVARVCRNDGGGSPRVLERRWTSFLKVRLLCAVPGDSAFPFDVLEAVTPPRALHGRAAVLALFGTQPNSIPGSAVCAFFLADVERAFEGPFAEPRGAAGAWSPVPEDRVPQPRPGCCAGMGRAAGISTSGDFPDETLSFAKEHPLLHGAVAPAGGRPLFTRTGTRLTRLAADTGAGPWRNGTVLFLGAEDGRVLKVLLPPGDSPGPGGDGGAASEALLLEEINLYDPARCQGPLGASGVLGLELHAPGRELFVAFAGCLVRLPLGRCAQYGACRRSCLAARDPYCAWLPPAGCVPVPQHLPSSFEQDTEGPPGSCADPPPAGDSDGAEDRAHGQWLHRPGPGPAVPLPLLAGCALGAFALGAAAAALLSAFCRRPAELKAPPEPPGAAPPPPPRLYPELPPPGGAADPPEPPPPERAPEPRRSPRGCPEPAGPGPPPGAAPEELRLHREGGGSGRPRPPPGSGSSNRVQPGAPRPERPLGAQHRAPQMMDVPPDSPPPPRRALALRHSLEGAPPPMRPPGLARALTRMHSLGGPRPPPALERSVPLKPPVLPKPLQAPAAPGGL
ncbi:semaphorin-6C [Ara ararauna]